MGFEIKLKNKYQNAIKKERIIIDRYLIVLLALLFFGLVLSIILTITSLIVITSIFLLINVITIFLVTQFYVPLKVYHHIIVPEVIDDLHHEKEGTYIFTLSDDTFISANNKSLLFPENAYFQWNHKISGKTNNGKDFEIFNTTISTTTSVGNNTTTITHLDGVYAVIKMKTDQTFQIRSNDRPHHKNPEMIQTGIYNADLVTTKKTDKEYKKQMDSLDSSAPYKKLRVFQFEQQTIGNLTQYLTIAKNMIIELKASSFHMAVLKDELHIAYETLTPERPPKELNESEFQDIKDRYSHCLNTILDFEIKSK